MNQLTAEWIIVKTTKCRCEFAKAAREQNQEGVEVTEALQSDLQRNESIRAK